MTSPRRRSVAPVVALIAAEALMLAALVLMVAVARVG